jgi:PEP-CTERM motif-containing protein
MSLSTCGRVSVFCFVVVLFASFARADTVSLTGNLPSASTDFQYVFTLTTSSSVTVKTWGFGGGVNAAGNTIAAGGFDPLVALFSGSGNSASIVLDAFGNEAAGADNLAGGLLGVPNCPPAGTVSIGGTSVCGDIKFTIAGLAAGTYTLLLTDANYVPYAVNPGPPLASTIGDGFADLTGGVFQTCTDETHCITPDSHYAVDISAPGLITPEPGTLVLLGTGVIACLRKLKR